MRLESLTVENFRSITSAKKIPMSNYTVLVGPNNEGKSNILKALTIGMNTLQKWRPRTLVASDGKKHFLPPDKHYRSYDAGYNWSLDYPINLQKSKSRTKTTEIIFEFRLDEEEVDEFYSFVGSSINGSIPIRISYSKEEFNISIAKPGRGSVTLNKKTTRVATFISDKLRFDYVPAVRTADSASNVVRKLVSNELKVLESDERYISAIKLIDEIQAPILDELSKSISSTVSSFLPSVRNVNLRASQSSRQDFFRKSIQIDIDDGVETDISQKGDGVQSLVALALMRHASERKSSSSIIAIEEPESHLHPRAVRDLRDVIWSLTSGSQVLVSSHSPLMVKWGDNTSTIIVADNRASIASKISDVRDVLGVLVTDNLTSVEFAVLVEGETDKLIIEKIISSLGSSSLKKMFNDNRFKIQSMRGVGKLAYSVNSYENNILGFHVFCDADDAAKSEVESAINKKVLKQNEYTICSCAGMRESEIEDCINPALYKSIILENYGIDISDKSFSGKEKWSRRLRDCFQKQGKIWNSQTENEIKVLVARLFEKTDLATSLIQQKSVPLHKLLEALEGKVHKAVNA